VCNDANIAWRLCHPHYLHMSTHTCACSPYRSHYGANSPNRVDYDARCEIRAVPHRRCRHLVRSVVVAYAMTSDQNLLADTTSRRRGFDGTTGYQVWVEYEVWDWLKWLNLFTLHFILPHNCGRLGEFDLQVCLRSSTGVPDGFAVCIAGHLRYGSL
jgi:hypothetical protein